MNSGDWVEHLSALEYNQGKWSLYQYEKLDFDVTNPRLHVKEQASTVFTFRREEVLPEQNGMAAFDAL
jgi:hypothetical protein